MTGFTSARLTRGSAGTVIAVPGILARSGEQMSPLRSFFDRHDFSLVGVDYDGVRFSPDACVDDLARIVRDNRSRSGRTIVFGSSLGGELSALAADQIGSAASDITWWFADSPHDGDDLVIPAFPAKANSAVGWLARHFTPRDRANTGYGKWLLDKMVMPPKDDAIELPPVERASAIVAGVQSQWVADYRQNVQRIARRNLSGHPFTLWYEQVRWMLGRTDLPLEVLYGLDTSYFACMQNNVTVRQPDAYKKWAPFMRSLVFVPTAHCAYLEAPSTWDLMMTTELDPE